MAPIDRSLKQLSANRLMNTALPIPLTLHCSECFACSECFCWVMKPSEAWITHLLEILLRKFCSSTIWAIPSTLARLSDLLLCYHIYWLTCLFSPNYTYTRGWERAFRTPSRKSYIFYSAFSSFRKVAFGNICAFQFPLFHSQENHASYPILTCIWFVSELVCDFLWCVPLNMPSILNFIW